jgi:hypothetical protein
MVRGLAPPPPMAVLEPAVNAGDQVAGSSSRQARSSSSGAAAVLLVAGTPQLHAAGGGPGSGSGPAGGQLPPQPPSVSARCAARLRVRMLPYLLASRGSSKWSMAKSSWRIRKAKLGAARVVVHRELVSGRTTCNRGGMLLCTQATHKWEGQVRSLSSL